ncbi:hypothetical protein T440DRAFT_429324 [Plenodomus tracheiphilus IPT5]|uniref:Protein kinase domain-containing protein n=1 Tax=Plenodomus tracheiphilus IPT5 TaxID=1408161 RepID=A0A6A7B117_9PLEO|nr:hypothetical protein T440DRAFT_429324 [Plenodomus tracheiphilus IPT5]
MADLVSIAGVTIAAFDKVWIIGCKAVAIVSDYQEFDKDSIELANDLQVENNRMKTLKCLLFEPSSAYSGQSLFEQFDHNVQIQLQVYLGKLLNIISESGELLKSQHITEGIHVVDQEISQHEMKVSTSLTLTRRASRTLRIRWSLWGKARLESIIKNFSKENDRLHKQVQMMCYATSIGVNLTHLDRLKTNEHSKRLGFDMTARLQLKVTGMETSAVSLQLRNDELYRNLATCARIESKFAVLSHLGINHLVEFRNYAPDKHEHVPLEGRTHERVERLAYLLRQRKDPLLHALPCDGWTIDAERNQVAFLFAVPKDTEGMPSSLLSVYENQAFRPSLGERFNLAKGLANSVSELHLVKWVHESIRSENILLLLRSGSPDVSTSAPTRLDFSQPWVMGFEFSRPELDFSSGRSDNDVARNVYRHPERQKHPQKPFAKIHDIYALGVVLLEIGLWRPVLSLEKDSFKRVSDPRTIQNYLIKKAEKSLPFQMGDRYKDIVVRCLTGNFDVDDDNKEDLKLQQAFRAKVIDVLDKTADSVG